MAAQTPSQLLDLLWPEGMSTRVNVWMILDAARDKRIFSAVDRSYQDKCCLYAGDLPWQLQMTAPYLVQLDREDRISRYFIDNGWGNSWGVFFRSESSFKNLRHHLRGFLRVRDQTGRRLIFRYYDPRVLRIYLPTCSRQELATVYGPIDEFVMESEDPSLVLEYSIENNKLREKRFVIGQTVGPEHGLVDTEQTT